MNIPTQAKTRLEWASRPFQRLTRGAAQPSLIHPSFGIVTISLRQIVHL